MSDSLWLHGLEHTRLPCPSLPPKVCWSLCPLSQWCYLTISSSAVLNLSQHQGLFQWVSSLHQGAKLLELQYFQFSISTSNEYSGLISFRVEWFDDLAAQRTLKSLLQHHNTKASILWLLSLHYVSLAFGMITSEHDYWKNHSLDYTDLCQQSNVSAF